MKKGTVVAYKKDTQNMVKRVPKIKEFHISNVFPVLQGGITISL